MDKLIDWVAGSALVLFGLVMAGIMLIVAMWPLWVAIAALMFIFG
jgi:hypothetical protein